MHKIPISNAELENEGDHFGFVKTTTKKRHTLADFEKKENIEIYRVCLAKNTNRI